MEIKIFFKDLSEKGQEDACKYLQSIGRKLSEEMLKNLEPVYIFNI